MSTGSAFTVTYNGISRSLVSDVEIAVAFDFALPKPHPTFKQYKGIWDTGATASVISQKVVAELGLLPTGMTRVQHAHGSTDAEVYLVNIALPNRVAFASVRVTKGELVSNDVLIGMDIICNGDFAVTNYLKKTVFSYKIPSSQTLDFTTPPLPPPVPQVGRNSPCPCGSGKKYKHCCIGIPRPPP